MKKYRKLILAVPLVGLSLSVAITQPAQAGITLLNGDYFMYGNDKSMGVNTDLIYGGQSGVVRLETWNDFITFDIDNNFTTNSMGTEVDTTLVQGIYWHWIQPVTGTTVPLVAGESITGPLATTYGNLSIYNVTEVEINDGIAEEESFDLPFITTIGGEFALSSFTEMERNYLSSGDGWSQSEDTFEFELISLLQIPSSALTNASMNGRYAIFGKETEIICDVYDEFDTCIIANTYTDSYYLDVIFNGDGTCTVPKIKANDTVEITSTDSIFVDPDTLYAPTKEIFHDDEFLYSSNLIDNADTGEDWEISSGTYTVSDTNLLQVTINDWEKSDHTITDTSTLNMRLSTNALYGKHHNDDDPTPTTLQSLFAMKMQEAPAPATLAGKTYLMSSTYSEKANYGLGDLEKILVAETSRTALTFADDGTCAMDLYFFDTEVLITNDGMTIEEDPENGRVQIPCTYAATGDPRVLAITYDAETEFARFSEDYEVIRMGATTIFDTGIVPSNGWEHELSEIRKASGIGVLYTGADVSAATDVWLDPQYWLDAGEAASVDGDFTGDGKADILLRNNSTGKLWLYTMNGNIVTASNNIGLLDPVWVVTGVADFTGDNNADILLRNSTTGKLWLYTMNGNIVTASNNIGLLDLVWDVAGVADFTGDNKADILLRNSTTGKLWLYTMNGNIVTASNNIGLLDPVWVVTGVADLNGDNNADILLRNSTTGKLWLYTMNGNIVTASNNIGLLDPVWDVTGVADLNGDNNADILLRNSTTGKLWLYTMNGNIVTASNNIGLLDPVWVVSDIADFTGDNNADILLRNSTTGKLWLYTMNGNIVTASNNIGLLDLIWIVQ